MKNFSLKKKAIRKFGPRNPFPSPQTRRPVSARAYHPGVEFGDRSRVVGPDSPQRLRTRLLELNFLLLKRRSIEMNPRNNDEWRYNRKRLKPHYRLLQRI